MNIEETERFERAALEAADGLIPPGDGALHDAGGEGTIENLRVLARVAQVHRAMTPRPEAHDESPAAPASTTPLFQWGTLLVLAPLGSGSFGEVYRALDPALGREVALKLRPAGEPATGPAARRWLDEARRLALVRQPNVVQVHGAAAHDDRPGMWMELVSGETLEQQLEQRGPMGYREACAVGIELCAALAAVHGAGCVHQDLKASNVMREGGPGREPGLGRSGRIVLMDFGAGQRLDASDHGVGGAFGTPLSCAPEVLAGEPPTPRSDVYSLGALLYRLVSGRHPIEAENAAELLAHARAGRVTPLRTLRPDLPLPFVSAVERALATDPSRRFAGAADFERELAAILSAGATKRPASKAPLAIGVVATIALAIAIAWIAGRRTDSSQASRSSSSAEGSRAGGAAASANPSAPASAPRPEVDARFLRAVPGGTEDVREGDLIAPGDQLALSLVTSEPLWFYVLDEDGTGKVVTLFPVRGLAPANPIPPGRHRLPGGRKGRALDWQVTSAGGHETFLFIASRTALPALETQLAGTAQAEEGAKVIDAGPGNGATRGVAGLAPSRISAQGSADRLVSLERSLAARADSAVWVRRVDVANPGP